VRRAAHGALAKVSSGIETLHFNVCLAHIREFANALAAALDAAAEQGGASPDLAWAVKEAAGILVQLFQPMMPHLAEECWATLGRLDGGSPAHARLAAEQPWPQVEAALLLEDTITLPVQVNGRKRGEVTVARDAENSAIEAAALTLDGVKKALDG